MIKKYIACHFNSQIYLFLFCSFFSQAIIGQDSFVFINEISISGNKHTKDGVILRELYFTKGDSISTILLSEIIKKSEASVLNTGLFNSVKIFYKAWEGSSGKVHIQIEIKEAWYIYPIPVFELVDRNFNVWWVEEQRALDRIKFGLEFTHANLTGRRDRLKITANYGYVQQYGLQYNFPYLNAAKTIGIKGGVSLKRKREVNYINTENKQRYYKNEDDFIYKKTSANIGITYRPGHQLTHEWGLTFNHKTITNDSILILNPFYFDNEKLSERAFSMSYAFTYDTRDIHVFPLNGLYFQVKITKPGLGVFKDKNILLLAIRYRHYHQLADKWSIGADFFGRTSLIRDQPPFENYRIMGSRETTVPGYEYYVLNGIDAVVLKPTIRFKALDVMLKFGQLMPLKSFRNIPFKVWIRANSGFGYANDPFDNGQNSLNKTLLIGGGPALEIIFFHDIIFRFEYSFNHLREKGLFLHFKANL